MFAVDDPSYFNFHALLRAHRARSSVSLYVERPDITAFAQALANIAAFYLMNSPSTIPTARPCPRRLLIAS